MLRHGAARALRRRHRGPGRRPGVAGAEIYKKQIIPLREIYGFTEDEIEFFDLHITSDVVHGERGYQIVLENANTPELQQRCLQFVRWGAEMRYSYTRSLYDTYVAPDLEGATQA